MPDGKTPPRFSQVSLGLGFPICKMEIVVLIFQSVEMIKINVLSLLYIGCLLER